MIGNIKIQKTNKGFTLAEMLVSIAIFSLVFGVIASLYTFNLKAQRRYLAEQQLLTEAGYVMNYMASHLERGLTQGESNCPAGCFTNHSDSVSYEKISSPGEGVKFISYKGGCGNFYVNNGRLYQQGSCPPVALVPGYITPSNLVVKKFKVNIIRGFQKAPRVTLYLKMTTTGKEKASIELQTTISKRKF